MQEYKDLFLVGLVYLIGTVALLGASWLTALVTS
jgi:hypothetical protein